MLLAWSLLRLRFSHRPHVRLGGSPGPIAGAFLDDTDGFANSRTPVCKVYSEIGSEVNVIGTDGEMA